MRRARVAAADFSVGAVHKAEFGCDDRSIAATGQCAADEDFIFAGAVFIGGVEQIATEVERAMDCGDRFGFVRAAVAMRETPAAEAEGERRRTDRSKLPLFHLLAPGR